MTSKINKEGAGGTFELPAPCFFRKKINVFQKILIIKNITPIYEHILLHSFPVKKNILFPDRTYFAAHDLKRKDTMSQ